MNPNDTIRPWLIACGKQYGIRYAFEYRWPDADACQEEMYCTYQSIEGSVELEGILDLSADAGSNVVTRKGCKDFYQLWQIDLYNSEDGLYELEAFCVAAEHSPALKKIFSDGGCAYAGMSRVANLTIHDESEVKHHFRLICAFREWVEISLSEVNGVVDQIDLTLQSDSVKHTITDSGIS